jgi:menaquinone-9 beta-reductase
MAYELVIVGAGPGGLACAAAAAQHGVKTIVLERKTILGQKVCAGGITWNGLIKKIPYDISEKKFPKQKITTPLQTIYIEEPEPIIATINRQKLGQLMASYAMESGAEIRLGCQVIGISPKTILYKEKECRKQYDLPFTFLVGADGSGSLIRRHLGLPIHKCGSGVQYWVPGDFKEMQWHLDSSLFANGYGWIFPHNGSASVGAYADIKSMKSKTLQNNLIKWARSIGINLAGLRAEAERINFDYCGWQFNNVFLVGDAAGLASGLTGEGIYSAMISGETIGHYIADNRYDVSELNKLIRNQKLHKKMVSLTGRHRIVSAIISELVTLGLRLRLLNFRQLEMAR